MSFDSTNTGTATLYIVQSCPVWDPFCLFLFQLVCMHVCMFFCLFICLFVCIRDCFYHRLYYTHSILRNTILRRHQ